MSKSFEAGKAKMTAHFFPLRYTLGRDMRKTTLRLEGNDHAMVQESDYMKKWNEPQHFLQTGNVRQTKAAPWSARRRPTHFVSLRLPDKCTIRNSIAALNNDIQESFTMSQWIDTFVPLSRLHLTLSVFSVEQTEAGKLQKAQLITRECIADWQRLTNGKGFALRSNSLGFFNEGRVAFARLSPDYDHFLLSKCVKEMRKKFADAGIDIKGNPHDEFVPHITIAKISPNITASHEKLKGAKTLPKSIFAHMQWDDLGLARFGDVDLCCMKSGKKAQAPQNEDENNNTGAATENAEEKADDAFEGLESTKEEGKEADAKKAVEAESSKSQQDATGSSSRRENVPYWDTLVRGSLFAARKF